MPRALAMAVALLLLAGAYRVPSLAGGGEASDSQEVGRQVGGLLEELDSSRYDVRRRAAAKIEEFLARPELKSTLATEFRRALLRPELSFEVRWQLERWMRRLPQQASEPPSNVAPEELDRLVKQLDDDSYHVRLGATRRLDWMIGNSRLISPIMARLKERLADPKVPADARARLETVRERVRGAWLLGPSADNDLPAVSDQEIARWMNDLSETTPAPVAGSPSLASQMAERELLDILCRDPFLPKVKAALEARLAEDPESDAAVRLQRLLDWTRPAMVAEFWQSRRHLGEQHLLVGVPSQAPMAARPSHFDRIDDQTAHCVSGNSLSPGDYPVGVAFPHPLQEGAVFHLVNLPTPRRRMAYTYYVKTSQAKRLAELSRRTLDRLVKLDRRLTEPELVMLAQLDPQEVSRFAGKVFLQIEDDRLTIGGIQRAGGRPSHHAMICAQLAADGTKQAVPGLLEAIQKNRILGPNTLAPYHLAWLAALSIAERDPWPEVDRWLAGAVGRTEALIEGQPHSPELGATAAVVLLKRRGQGLSDFGVEPARDPVLDRFGVSGYVFGSEESRKRVQQWWAKQAGP